MVTETSLLGDLMRGSLTKVNTETARDNTCHTVAYADILRHRCAFIMLGNPCHPLCTKPSGVIFSGGC